MDAHKASYSITLMAKVLAVTRAGYDAWKNRAPQRGERALVRRRLDKAVAWEHEVSGGTYGPPCVRHALTRAGVDVGVRAVAATRGAFPAGVVLHADRGTQFTSQKLAAYMRAVKGTVSMGQAAVCWDNAMAESFWATLTTEYYYRRTFTTRDQVYTGVATWIEDFYNRRRIHTSLGGKSPIEYELHQAAWTKAA